jgi:hypothetical protein
MRVFYNICYFVVAVLAIIAVSKGHNISAILALVLCVLCRVDIIEAHIEEIKKNNKSN